MSSLDPSFSGADTEMGGCQESQTLSCLDNTTLLASVSAQNNLNNTLLPDAFVDNSKHDTSPYNGLVPENHMAQNFNESFASSSKTYISSNSSLHHSLQQSSSSVVPAQFPPSQLLDNVNLNLAFNLSVQLQYFHDFVERRLKYHPFTFRLSSAEEISEEISCWGPEKCHQFATYIQGQTESERQNPQLLMKREMRISQRESARQRAEQSRQGDDATMYDNGEEGEEDELNVRNGKDVMEVDSGGKRVLDFEPNEEGATKRVAHPWS